jgi:hypothetical protein
VKSVVGAVCLCFDSWQILLLDARCRENLPFGAFLVLESWPGEVFLYCQCWVHSVSNAVTETDFLLWWSCPSMCHKDLGVEVQFHQFFIKALDEGELLASYRGWFSPKKCTPTCPFVRRLSGGLQIWSACIASACSWAMIPQLSSP